jgi:hypothetical protein
MTVFSEGRVEMSVDTDGSGSTSSRALVAVG